MSSRIYKGRARVKVTRGDVGSIEAEYRQYRREPFGLRLHAVLQVAKGQKAEDIAASHQVSLRSVPGWIHRYNSGGPEELKDKPRSGRKPRLSDEQKSEFKRIVTEQTPKDYGFNSGTWSGPILCDLIKRLFNVIIGRVQIYYILESQCLSHQ